MFILDAVGSLMYVQMLDLGVDNTGAAIVSFPRNCVGGGKVVQICVLSNSVAHGN